MIIAIWGFLVTDDGAGSLFSTIPVNTEDNFLHLILGLTGLAAGAATPKPGGSSGRSRRAPRKRGGKREEPRTLRQRAADRRARDAR